LVRCSRHLLSVRRGGVCLSRAVWYGCFPLAHVLIGFTRQSSHSMSHPWSVSKSRPFFIASRAGCGLDVTVGYILSKLASGSSLHSRMLSNVSSFHWMSKIVLSTRPVSSSVAEVVGYLSLLAQSSACCILESMHRFRRDRMHAAEFQGERLLGWVGDGSIGAYHILWWSGGIGAVRSRRSGRPHMTWRTVPGRPTSGCISRPVRWPTDEHVPSRYVASRRRRSPCESRGLCSWRGARRVRRPPPAPRLRRSVDRLCIRRCLP
jgi:hypothetical protein